MNSKKIGLIICYSVLALLGVAVILCSLIPVNYLPKINDPQYLTITSLSNSSKQAFYDVNSEYVNKDDYNDFLSEFKSAFSQSVLTALFTGKLSSEAQVYPNPNSSYPTEGYRVTFGYTDYQNIYVNGQKYKDPSFSTRDVVYRTMNCYITEDEGFATFYLYFEDDSEDTTTVYRMTTIASIAGLYNHISEIDVLK